MSLAVVCAACLLRAQVVAPITPGHTDVEILSWQARHIAESETNQAVKREAAYEERQFVSKFNSLLDTLRAFAGQYNHHVVDIKKLKALKKAWRDLEKTDAWFRLDEKTGH